MLSASGSCNTFYSIRYTVVNESHHQTSVPNSPQRRNVVFVASYFDNDDDLDIKGHTMSGLAKQWLVTCPCKSNGGLLQNKFLQLHTT